MRHWAVVAAIMVAGWGSAGLCMADEAAAAGAAGEMAEAGAAVVDAEAGGEKAGDDAPANAAPAEMPPTGTPPVEVVPAETAPAETAPAETVAADPVPADDPPAADDKLWTCETSIAGENTEINYLRDDEFRHNVGSLEKKFSGWGRISCPGYVSLREILRRNAMADDGSYCLLWDKSGDTYIGARKGARKGNALCRKTLCQRVNDARQATFRNANAMAVAGFDAVTQRPGATILAATSGSMVGTLQAAGAAAMGVAASPVAVGSMVVGSAAVGGTMWYCAEE